MKRPHTGKMNDTFELAKKAVERGDISLVKIYVENCPSFAFHQSSYLLRKAVILGHKEIVRYLLEKGANPRACHEEAFYMAKHYGRKEIFFLLMDYAYDNSNMHNQK